jgi:hypothetical protein
MTNVIRARFKDQAFLDRLASELEAGESSVLPENFHKTAEQIFREDLSRRVALIYLERPWMETSDGIRMDRKSAILFAKLAERLEDSIGFCKDLESLLRTAQNRIRAAVSRREDGEAVLVEVKELLAAEATAMM